MTLSDRTLDVEEATLGNSPGGLWMSELSIYFRVRRLLRFHSPGEAGDVTDEGNPDFADKP